MEERRIKLENWKKILLLVLSFVIVVVLAVILINILIPKEYNKVSIVNAEVLNEVDSDEINLFKIQLLHLLQEQGLVAEGATVDDVEIREDTVSSYTTINEGKYIKQTSFLADLDSAKQTYQVDIYDTNQTMNDAAVQISCPLVSEMKYPEEMCTGVYGYNNRSVKLWLPYELMLNTGEKILIKKVEMVSGRSTLQVYLYSCDEKTPSIAGAEEMVKDWVSSLGDPAAKNYVYNVRAGYCEGDAI